MAEDPLSGLVPEDALGVRSRLPEIAGLRGAVRDEVARAFVEDVPGYFWIVRASADYHPPDTRGPGGLWLHTKRVFSAYHMLEDTYRTLGLIDSYEANCARAACLLHDGFKYGRAPDADEAEHDYADGRLDHLPAYTLAQHDVMMADHVRTETDLPDEVARCVESHGGSTAWGSHDGPPPTDDLEMVVHLADMLASNQHHRIPVHGCATSLARMIPSDVPVLPDEETERLKL